MDWLIQLEPWQLILLTVSPFAVVAVIVLLILWYRSATKMFRMVRMQDGSEDSLLKLVLREGLMDQGARALPALEWGLNSARIHIRRRCVLILARMTNLERVVTLLLELLVDPDLTIRETAAAGLTAVPEQVATALRPVLRLDQGGIQLQYRLVALVRNPGATALLRPEIQQIMLNAGIAGRDARILSLLAMRALQGITVFEEVMLDVLASCLHEACDAEELGFAVDLAGLFGTLGRNRLEHLLETILAGTETSKELNHRCTVALRRMRNVTTTE